MSRSSEESDVVIVHAVAEEPTATGGHDDNIAEAVAVAIDADDDDPHSDTSAHRAPSSGPGASSPDEDETEVISRSASVSAVASVVAVAVDNDEESAPSSPTATQRRTNVELGSSSTNHNETHTRAQFASASLVKGVSTSIGLTLRPDENGDVRVAAITSASASLSPIRVGDVILSVNGRSVAGHDSETISSLFGAGANAIVAHIPNGEANHVESMVEKTSPDCTVGISFSTGARGGLEVAGIVPDGRFSSSLITRGDRVLSINSVPCRLLDARTAVSIIESCPTHVTILAETTSATGVVVAASERRGMRHNQTSIQDEPHRNTRRLWIFLGCAALFIFVLASSASSQ